MRQQLIIGGSLASALTGCTTPAETETSTPPGISGPSSATPTGEASSSPTASGEAPSSSARSSETEKGHGLVRFSSSGTSVDVKITHENPAARDLLSMLPLTMPVLEFAGREKIGDLPRELEIEGSKGSEPVDGDLIYFKPWGHVGFYYNTAGTGYSDQTIHLGTCDATVDQLELLEGTDITVARVE